MPTRFNFFCEIRKYLWSDSFSWQYSGINEWPEHNPTPQSRNPRPLRLGDSSWLWNLKPYWCESPEGHGTALTSVQCLPFSSARMTLRKSCSHHKFSIFFLFKPYAQESKSKQMRVLIGFKNRCVPPPWTQTSSLWERPEQTGRSSDTSCNELTCKASVPQAAFFCSSCDFPQFRPIL